MFRTLERIQSNQPNLRALEGLHCMTRNKLNLAYCSYLRREYWISSQMFRWTQGTNARKVISEVYAFLYCSVLSLSGKVNTRRMSQPDMESIFTKIIYEIFWS